VVVNPYMQTLHGHVAILPLVLGGLYKEKLTKEIKQNVTPLMSRFVDLGVK
jgi:hypothetical protein